MPGLHFHAGSRLATVEFEAPAGGARVAILDVGEFLQGGICERRPYFVCYTSHNGQWGYGVSNWLRLGQTTIINI